MPSEQEILEKKLTVRYDPVTDVYERGSQRTTGENSHNVTFAMKYLKIMNNIPKGFLSHPRFYLCDI